MTDLSPLARKAIEQARQGEFDLALLTAKEAISEDPNDKGLRFFAGLLHSRRFEFEEAAAQLREAMALAPDDLLVRTELVRVLGSIGRLDEAERLIDAPGLPPQIERRLRAMLASARGEHSTAAQLYRTVVRDEPRDFESWGNMGVSLLAAGEAADAVHALRQALKLKPGNLRLQDKLAEAHVAAGTAEEALRELYDHGSRDPAALVTAARLEDLQERPDRAVDALQRALRIEPANLEALVGLADLQERGNRIDELHDTLERLEQLGFRSDKVMLLRARVALRQGDMAGALELAKQISRHSDPAARAQLLGQIHDRLGNRGEAFEAFAEMNRIDALATEDAARKAERYLTSVWEKADVLTSDWVSRWCEPPPTTREPAFLLGFPRSGTTLLDTLLMNDAGVAVSEENPLLTHVSGQVGGFERIADLEPDEIARLRELYFEKAETYVPQSRGLLLVDKFPFALGAGPLIHRLFPSAPVVFLSRHPCDVVLSCFMTRFQPTEVGSAFLTLEGTAKLYDAMMTLWARSRELLELHVHDACYETLVENPKLEMRQIAQFLGIGWSDALADNLAVAERRGFIKTPSYSQVAEPIYRRAVERWRNYEEQLQPVIPILEPWIRALGYRS